MIVSMIKDQQEKYLLEESRRVENVKAPALKGPCNSVALYTDPIQEIVLSYSWERG
jgi:hypothetical protein